jgi:hypothetical protein
MDQNNHRPKLKEQKPDVICKLKKVYLPGINLRQNRSVTNASKNKLRGPAIRNGNKEAKKPNRSRHGQHKLNNKTRIRHLETISNRGREKKKVATSFTHRSTTNGDKETNKLDRSRHGHRK